MRNFTLTQTGQEVQDILNKAVVYGTTSYWESLPDLVPVEGQIVVYSDYSETEPGLKVGDGVTAVGSLAFLGAAESAALLEHINDSVRHITAAERQAWNAKQDAEEGKGLSTEDYTTAEKEKLAGIEAGADQSVNADWEASSGKAAILHKPDLSQFVTKMVDDLVYYYTKSETYTKDEIAQLLSAITTGFWQVVPYLPEASADTFGFKIYLAPAQAPHTQNVKDEYITVRSGEPGSYTYSWELIGSTAIDLSDYVTNDALQTALEGYVSTEAFQQTIINYLQVPAETTWANLIGLRNGGTLLPGRLYRITDYVATTIQADTRSANHPFDIIVQALSTNTLSEDAHAALHSGDSYFAMANLNAWRLRYAIDNDPTRFAWADSTNGKGVVYRLVDEWGNDIPYDFKGIQFKRYYVASVVTGYSPALSPMIGLPIGLSSSRGLTLGTEYEWYYTFSSLGNTWSDAATDGSLNGKTVQRNKIVSNQFDSSGNRKLNNNVFAGGKVLYDYMIALDAEANLENFFHFFDNTFEGESIINNTVFGYMCLSHTQAAFRHNTVLGMMRHCEIGSTFDTNTILITKDFAFFSTKERFGNNVIRAKSIGRCSFGNYFDSNFLVISNQCSINTFGDNFQSNTLSASTVAFNRIGNYISSNTFTDVELRSCQFDGQLNNCEFSGNITSCSFKPLTSYLIVVGGTNGSRLAGVDFVGSVRGTSSSKVRIESSYFLLDSVSEIKRRITLEGDVNGKMVATWYNGGKRVGITKAPADAEWTALPEAYFKPSGGIPSTDMSSDVQTSLGKADTALQSFTETDPTVPSWAKEQNPPQEIFWATYGTTTFSAINTALGDNKVVLCKYGELVYVLTSYEESFFFSCPLGSSTYYLTVTSSNEWDNGSLQAELAQNKKTSVSANASSNTYYPTTKAVADAVSAVDKVFWATYGTTTIAEVRAAISAGKFVVTLYDGYVYVNNYYDSVESPGSDSYYFSCLAADEPIGYWLVLDSTGWSNDSFTLENANHRVSSWQNTPDNQHYPAEKLVKDSLDAKYEKPSGGIPKTDLASAVKISLGYADNAVRYNTSVQGLTAEQMQNARNNIGALGNDRAQVLASGPYDPYSSDDWKEGDIFIKQGTFTQISPTYTDSGGMWSSTRTYNLSSYSATKRIKATNFSGADFASYVDADNNSVSFDPLGDVYFPVGVKSVVLENDMMSENSADFYTEDSPDQYFEFHDNAWVTRVLFSGNYNDLTNKPTIPDAVEANPTVPSGTTPTALTGLKIGSDYYDIEAGGGTVTDVTVGGTSVVSSGTAAIPAMPTLATGMSAIKIWAGTQAEYDLLTPASDTLYFIKES